MTLPALLPPLGKNGALDGCDEQDWLRAEAELKTEHHA